MWIFWWVLYTIRLKTQIQPEIWNWIRLQLERRIDLQGMMDTSCSSWDAKQAKSAKWLVDSPPTPMRSEIHVTHISNSIEFLGWYPHDQCDQPWRSIELTEWRIQAAVLVHKQQVSYCHVTPHLSARTGEPPKVLKILYSIPCKKR